MSTFNEKNDYNNKYSHVSNINLLYCDPVLFQIKTIRQANENEYRL